jgi:hypothetical protein
MHAHGSENLASLTDYAMQMRQVIGSGLKFQDAVGASAS